MIHKLSLVLLICILALPGCNKPSSPSSATSAASGNPSDLVESRLKDLAGSGATNCGHLKSQDLNQMDAASQCAMQAAQSKKPFYVAYDLPGMTVAVAGNSEGKLFSVQTQATPSVAGSPAGLASGSCPAELRVAPSGRVTCFAPGTFPVGMGAGGTNPHGGAMPPASGENPHKGLGIPPPLQANPHQQKPKPPANPQ